MSKPKETEVELEEKPKKPKTALEKLRSGGFDTKTGEWSGLKWKQQDSEKFQVVGKSGLLVDENDKPIELDAIEASVFFSEITKARPGDGVRLVPIN